MKECCKTSYTAKPEKWRKYAKQFVYLLLFGVLVFAFVRDISG